MPAPPEAAAAASVPHPCRDPSNRGRRLTPPAPRPAQFRVMWREGIRKVGLPRSASVDPNSSRNGTHYTCEGGRLSRTNPEHICCSAGCRPPVKAGTSREARPELSSRCRGTHPDPARLLRLTRLRRGPTRCPADALSVRTVLPLESVGPSGADCMRVGEAPKHIGSPRNAQSRERWIAAARPPNPGRLDDLGHIVHRRPTPPPHSRADAALRHPQGKHRWRGAGVGASMISRDTVTSNASSTHPSHAAPKASH
jgi:hypothetical protein